MVLNIMSKRYSQQPVQSVCCLVSLVEHWKKSLNEPKATFYLDKKDKLEDDNLFLCLCFEGYTFSNFRAYSWFYIQESLLIGRGGGNHIEFQGSNMGLPHSIKYIALASDLCLFHCCRGWLSLGAFTVALQ